MTKRDSLTKRIFTSPVTWALGATAVATYTRTVYILRNIARTVCSKPKVYCAADVFKNGGKCWTYHNDKHLTVTPPISSDIESIEINHRYNRLELSVNKHTLYYYDNHGAFNENELELMLVSNHITIIISCAIALVLNAIYINITKDDH